jgi:hypothetical protein
MILRLTCPYTSQQNGWTERVICTLNDSVRALMFHADVPWHSRRKLSPRPLTLLTDGHADHTTMTLLWWQSWMVTFLLPLNEIRAKVWSWQKQFLQVALRPAPHLWHLHVFGCLCYPKLTATAANKLSPCSIACIFLGYSPNTKDNRCYNPETNRVIVSRHVNFGDDVFPFWSRSPPAPKT